MPQKVRYACPYESSQSPAELLLRHTTCDLFETAAGLVVGLYNMRFYASRTFVIVHRSCPDKLGDPGANASCTTNNQLSEKSSCLYIPAALLSFESLLGAV